MQIDMHYYGVYALARMAGLKPAASKTVARASQYVDDAVDEEFVCHSNGNKLATIVTAHRTIDLMKNSNPKDQPFVWVPFHFFPGNEGNSFTERMICRKDSNLVNEMIDRHIEMAGSPFAIELMGLAAHVYMDTFSHYGFSGVSSEENRVKAGSIGAVDDSLQYDILDKLHRFFEKYGAQGGLWPHIKDVDAFTSISNWDKKIKHLIKLADTIAKRIKREGLNKVIGEGVTIALGIASKSGEILSGALGHGAVAILPDLPYLEWKFTYEEQVSAVPVPPRDNRETFLEGCEKLCKVFRRFLSKMPEAGDGTNGVAFDTVKSKIKDILSLKKEKEERCDAWQKAFYSGALGIPAGQQIPAYQETLWKEQRDHFKDMTNPETANQWEVYRFYQAASFHQHYVLRELLPKNGLIVI